MKTIELKWIEDDNHVVAEDAYTGLKELIETGVFPNLKVECKDDTLYITGEQEDLDKAVAKLQKSYIKYGQIAIRENHKKPEGIRIESYDANVQDIFDHTLKDFEEFKESTKSNDYITKLGKFQVKFNRLKEAASDKDKKLIQNYIDEIIDLTENAETKAKIKPIKKKNARKPKDPNKNYKKPDYINPDMKGGTYKDGDVTVYEMPEENESLKSQYNKQLKSQLSNLDNWGIIEEAMSREEYNSKYDEVALAYAKETGMDLDDAYDELMDKDELVNYIEGPYDVDEIIYKLLNESTTMNESFLSPAEMKKKLTRVAAKWAYENGMKFDDAYNELRKKKSVKDMLDFYSVEEIIDDLKQKKTEEDDEIVESRGEPRKIKSRAELIRKAIKQDAIEIESWDEYETIKENQLMNELGYSMDINGNKTGAIWMGDKDGKMYYCTNPGILIRT